MPTYGWVREDAWEAFLEGTEAVPSPGLPLPPRFNCPFCSRVLADQRELQDHVADEHRIDRPVFMVDGHEPASEFTIRKHCAPDRYIVANATSVRMVIDGERVKAPPPSELGRRLAELKWATVEVTLINAAQRTAAPVTSAYRISIMVADQRDPSRCRVGVRPMDHGSKPLDRINPEVSGRRQMPRHRRRLCRRLGQLRHGHTRQGAPGRSGSEFALGAIPRSVRSFTGESSAL